MEPTRTVFHSLKDAAAATGISLDTLLRARAHPECPHTTEGGFAASGRVYITDTFKQWIIDHKAELDSVEGETRDYWLLRRYRANALLAELNLEEKYKRIVNKQDVIDLLDRIAFAQVSLFNSRLRQELPARWNLPTEKIAELDAVIAEIFGVLTKQLSAWK